MHIDPILTVTYHVTAYDASWGGYGDDRSRSFDTEAEAVEYARTIPLPAPGCPNYNTTVWKRVTMQPIITPVSWR